MIERTAGEADEPVIEPDLEITDAHHHFFPPGEHDWPGLLDYSLDHWLADTGAGHRVTSSVWVEARGGFPRWSPLDEVNAITEIARESERRGGAVVRALVGDADLRQSDVGDVLDQLHEASEGRLSGIRHASLWDASPDIATYPSKPGEGLLRRPEFLTGFGELARRDMTFDAWMYHPQLLDLAPLADAFPETRIIVDHLGGPTKLGPYGADRDATLSVWRRHMSELSKRTNVFVKLGGIGLMDFADPVDVTGDADVEPTSEQLANYWRNELRWLIETFGVNRCMFESNFPIDNPMCSYVVLWNAFKRIVADASPEEKRALFAGTANRVYGIKGQ